MDPSQPHARISCPSKSPSDFKFVVVQPVSDGERIVAIAMHRFLIANQVFSIIPAVYLCGDLKASLLTPALLLVGMNGRLEEQWSRKR